MKPFCDGEATRQKEQDKRQRLLEVKNKTKHLRTWTLVPRDGKIHTSLFDKRDAFGFTIVNFPDLSGNIPEKQSYGVFVSQLIRYARCCQYLADFRERTRKLVDRLVCQNFSLLKLANTFEKFAESHYELLFKYGVHVCPACC